MNLPLLREGAFDGGKGGKFIRLIKKATGKPDFILKNEYAHGKPALS